MKPCLYLELEEKLRCSGIGTAINNQRKALELNNVEYTNNLKDDFDILHINTIGPHSLLLAKKMKKEGKKIIVHAHTTADDFKNSFSFSNHIAPLLKRYDFYCYNQADLVLCPSEYTKTVLKKSGVKKEIRVISNGIDTQEFRFSKKKREKFRREFNLQGIVPFNVGHLFIRKGISTFANTAKWFQNRFLWIGKRYKSFEDKKVTDIVENAPENVNFAGYIPNTVSAYSGGDIFFFPSLCENQGIAILEAAACENPILVRDIPTYDGWLTDEVNCLKARTDREFVGQLQRLLDDEELRLRLSKNANKMTEEHSLEGIGSELKEIYKYLE